MKNFGISMSMINEVHYDNEEFLALIKTDDFDCLPRSFQVRLFTKFLLDSGNEIIRSLDIKNLFAKAKLQSPRNGKLISISEAQITKYIDKLIDNEDFTLIQNSINEYRISMGSIVDSI